jgi:hypothetical protein
MKITYSNTTVDEKRDLVKTLLEEAGSRFVTIEFAKKDGSNRVMNIQQAVLADRLVGDDASETSKARVATRKANNPHLMSVWDVQSQAIKSINLDSTHAVRANGREYVFEA